MSSKKSKDAASAVAVAASASSQLNKIDEEAAVIAAADAAAVLLAVSENQKNFDGGSGKISRATSSLSSLSSSTATSTKQIKMEPGVKINNFDEILKKRKAAIALEKAAERVATVVPVENSAPANFSDLALKYAATNAKIATSQQSSSLLNNSSSSSNTVKKASVPQQQQFTDVDYRIYYIMGRNNEELTACVTIGNIFGMKDIFLGNASLPGGDSFYWKCKMMYPKQIDQYMLDAHIDDYSHAEFLRNFQGKPLIIMSFLTETSSLLTFEEVNSYAQVIMFCYFYYALHFIDFGSFSFHNLI